jgi:anaerobic magnesium-protoporphyrin IX monomethyl ester cyclase
VDVLLIQPPKKYWPFVSADDNFVVPQSLVYLAAHAREAGLDVAIVDCNPIKMGWRSLADYVREHKPRVVGIGENHALYSHEAIKAFRMVKEINPDCFTIAGGAHFAHLYKTALLDPAIDHVVFGEGELTFTELAQRLNGHTGTSKPDVSDILGIGYEEDGEIISNGSRPLIRDLDTLPIPAYDLIPMDLYGTSKYLFSPGGATVQHSRGCTLSCSFCAWWTQFATRKEDAEGNALLTPRWRTFSVDRHLEEVELLVKRYDKRCMMYVDASFNISAKWNLEFSEEVIKRKLPIKWFAFARADCMLRDHDNGVLPKMVEAGMAHVCIGVERAEDTDLKNWNKHRYSQSETRRVFKILKDDYPQVFRQGTFIVGVKDETPDSMWQQAELAQDLDLDYPAFHPVTPVPGTPVYEEALRNGDIEVNDFSQFDWMTPVMPSKYMSRDEIAWQIYHLNKKLVTPKWLMKGLTAKEPYRRHMYAWWAKVAANMALDLAKQRINPFKTRDYMNLVKPEWYDH